jgi:uncharacterized membrane protein HdeD (DUF308 family)
MASNPTFGVGDSARSRAMSSMLARNWWVVALRGVLAVLFGLAALFLTGPAILSLVLLFSAYMLVDGIFAIAAGVRAATHRERWGLLIFEGIVDIAAGIIAFLWPAITVIAFVLLMAAWSLVSGALTLAASFQLNKDHGRWWLALGGIASIVLGVMLVIAPAVGAIVLTWWIGAYAVVFGITILALAFKLRQRREEQKPFPRAT